MNQTSRIEEIQNVLGLRDNRRHLISQTLDLLSQAEVMAYFVLPFELHRIVLDFEFVELFY